MSHESYILFSSRRVNSILGLGFSKWQLSQQVKDLLKKSPKSLNVYLRILINPFTSVVDDYFGVDEYKVSLMIYVPQSLGKCSPSPFPLLFPIPFLYLIAGEFELRRM